MQKKLSKFSTNFKTHLWLKKKKTLQKVSIEGTYLNIIKAIYDKPTAIIIFNGEKLKMFPLRSRTIQGCLLSLLLFSIVLEVLAFSNQRRKRNEMNPDWKRSKTSTVCRQHDTIHRNPKDAISKLLEQISEFIKVAGYKINT